ncbi:MULTISPECIES: hypothetical protein [unclassified Polaromonas]|jgi:hypothetical protein|uniref:hypothetical protein n=1 Tax=unclassified Polaromonas TaxID=2638319 RepID=UPI0025EDC332|nr:MULTISPECIES: hypothetical protein [unclassified Polaromonas]
MLTATKQQGKGVKRTRKLPLDIFRWQGYAFDLTGFFEISSLQDINKKKIPEVASSDISAQVRAMNGTNYFYCVKEATRLTTADAMDQRFSPKLYMPKGEEGNPSRSKQWTGYQKGRLPRRRKRKEVEKLSGYSFEHEVESLVWSWLDISQPLPRNTLELVRKMKLWDEGTSYLVLSRLKSGEVCDAAIHELGDILCCSASFERFGLLVMMFRTAVEKARTQASCLLGAQVVRMLVMIGGQLHQRGICARMIRFVTDHLLPLSPWRSDFSPQEMAKMSALLHFLSSVHISRYENRFWTYASQSANIHFCVHHMGSGFAEIFHVLFPNRSGQAVGARAVLRDQALENFAIFLEAGNFPLMLHEEYFWMNCDFRELALKDAAEIAQVVRSLKSPLAITERSPLDTEALGFPWLGKGKQLPPNGSSDAL